MTYELLENLANKELLIVLGLLMLMTFGCLIRAILGPRTADRMIAVNMIGTIVMGAILVLAVYLNEGYLVDVALIYSMISFLAVIVLSKVLTGVYAEHKEEKGKQAIQGIKAEGDKKEEEKP